MNTNIIGYTLLTWKRGVPTIGSVASHNNNTITTRHFENREVAVEDRNYPPNTTFVMCGDGRITFPLSDKSIATLYPPNYLTHLIPRKT